MSLLDIHVLGSPVLRKETRLVSEFDESLRTLINDMFETMYAAKGIGLAAPQVGRLERVAVLDVDDSPLVIVNPEVVENEGTIKGEEGCLSIPEIYADVEHAHGRPPPRRCGALTRRAWCSTRSTATARSGSS